MTKAARRIIGLYSDNAETWAKQRLQSIEHHVWLDRFLDLLTRHPCVLDLGCGTGDPIARYLMKRGAAVTGVDAASGMIEHAARTHPKAEWHIADMRELDLHRRFDGIVAWNSFFHLTPEDQRGMFPVFARHARAGAALLFTSGPEHGVAMGEMFGEPLYHASLDPAEYRALLGEAGFEVVPYVPEDPECGQHTVWLARARG